MNEKFIKGIEMSKSSIVTMKDSFRKQLVDPLKVFVTTNHDKYFQQEGAGGIIAVTPCENVAVEMIDLELKKRGLFPRKDHFYMLRSIPLGSPYSELICDAPVNGGPDPRSAKARMVSPKFRELGDPVLFISFDHHSHLPGIAGAMAIADSYVLAGELIDASLMRRGLLPNSRRSYSMIEFSLKSSFVEVLVE